MFAHDIHLEAVVIEEGGELFGGRSWKIHPKIVVVVLDLQSVLVPVVVPVVVVVVVIVTLLVMLSFVVVHAAI